MCGIAGLWAPGLPGDERRALVRAMLERLLHRGPDGVDLWSDGEATLGLARLAIVGVDHPARVLGDEVARVHAVVNGELYDYRELSRDLAAGGCRVPPGPDTSLVIPLYARDGEDFPRRADGRFAAAIWDAPRRRLILARDRAGV